MMKKFSVLGAFFALSLLPHTVHAARTFAEVVDGGQGSIVSYFDSYVIPLLYAVMFLLFMFGMVRYFFTGGEENREKGKQFVLWGMVGMVAVFSIWGVVNLLLSVLAV